MLYTTDEKKVEDTVNLKTVARGLLIVIVLLLLSCFPPVRPTGPSDDTPSRELGWTEPVGGSYKSAGTGVVPASMTHTDITYYLMAPDLNGFFDAVRGYAEGRTPRPLPFLGTTVAFTGERFQEGIHGISDGLRLSGTLTDGSGTITFEMNPDTSRFWYEQKVFLDDPHKVIVSTHDCTSQTVHYLEMEGRLDQEDCGAARMVSGLFSTYSAHETMLAVVKDGEFYTGTWNASDESVTGSGVAFNRVSFTSEPESSYGRIHQPGEPLDAWDIDQAVEYIKAYIASNPDDIPQYTLIYRTTADQHSQQFLTGLWDRVCIGSPAAAKACLPSQEWRNVSRLDTY